MTVSREFQPLRPAAQTPLSERDSAFAGYPQHARDGIAFIEGHLQMSAYAIEVAKGLSEDTEAHDLADQTRQSNEDIATGAARMLDIFSPHLEGEPWLRAIHQDIASRRKTDKTPTQPIPIVVENIPETDVDEEILCIFAWADSD